MTHSQQDGAGSPGTVAGTVAAGTVAAGAADADPAVGLRAVRALGELADRLESLQVGRARALGWSWRQVADALGVSRQAVHQKHRNTPVPAERPADGAPHHGTNDRGD